ncbi:DNA polymerase Y family protein [Streptomyces syringium]|uniref:DNA polymerase Y family protein n=1 Tax=Streptomyces syringium TaxID=76729 RepID=UPI0033F30DFB
MARQILHAHFTLPPGAGPGLYEQLLAIACGITPGVQALPPDCALLDLTGACRYWDRDARGVSDILRIRALALAGAPTTCAIAPNRMLATMALAATGPGATTVLAEHDVTAWLRPRPVAALYGVGPATAESLTRHGLHSIGDLADAPLPALTRLFGTATGRMLHARAHGHDPRPAQPQPVPQSTSCEYRFTADCLDADQHRRALLDLAHQLGARLRDTRQAASSLTLTVRYADGTTTTRTRALSEPTNHTAPITATAYDVHRLLGLQRARVRALVLRAEALRPAAEMAQQLAFGPDDDRARAIEAVTDRARARFGAGALKPAALARPAR